MPDGTEGTVPGFPRSGYDPNFLGIHLEVPDPRFRDDGVLIEGTRVVPNAHFSLSLSRPRRFLRWVGWNIDGGNIKLLCRSDLGFTKDPRLPAKAQVGNELYASSGLDRGILPVCTGSHCDGRLRGPAPCDGLDSASVPPTGGSRTRKSSSMRS